MLPGVALLPALHFSSASAQTGVTPDVARAIAKEAYIYGEPIVDNYRIQHAYWVDKSNPEYKGTYNELWNSARLFSPADVAIQTPNSDTDVAAVQEGCRRRAYFLHPERNPRRRQGIQLAFCTEGAVPHVVASLLAEGRSLGGQVDSAAAHAGDIGSSY